MNTSLILRQVAYICPHVDSKASHTHQTFAGFRSEGCFLDSLLRDDETRSVDGGVIGVVCHFGAEAAA